MNTIEMVAIPEYRCTGQAWRATFEERKSAAMTLYRLWKQSRAGIDHLRKDREVLSAIPHQKFKMYCHKRLLPLLKRGQSNLKRKQNVDGAISRFQDYRDKCQQQSYIPYCKFVSGKGKMPHFEILSPKTVQSKFRVGHVYLSEEAALQYSRNAKAPLNKKADLDTILRRLARQIALFPWAYKSNGCSTRSRVAIDFLLLSGIPLKNLGKIFICMPKKYRALGAMHTWNYHVAITGKLLNGTRWIFDPSLSTKRVFSLTEWIEMQKRFPLQEMPIANLGHFDPHNSEQLKLSFSHDACVILSTGPRVSVADQDFDLGHLVLARGVKDRQNLKTLAIYRSKLEKQWIKI